MTYVTCKSCNATKPIEEYPLRPKTYKGKSKTHKKTYWVCRVCLKTKRFEFHLKRHGMTIGEYEIMAQKQAYCCAICGKRPKKLAMDHDHEKGKVRGLLCRQCNCLLGLAYENGVILQNAIEYLDQHEANSKDHTKS